MTRDGEGMQVPCTLYFKAQNKFVDILKKELSGTALTGLTHFIKCKERQYTAASKYVQCFGLQYYVVFDLSGVDKRSSSYRG